MARTTRVRQVASGYVAFVVKLPLHHLSGRLRSVFLLKILLCIGEVLLDLHQMGFSLEELTRELRELPSETGEVIV